MNVSLSDPSYLSALYFGTLSLVLLIGFSSLMFEVERGLNKLKEAADKEVESVVWATANVNLLVIAGVSFFIGYFCVQLGQVGQYWQQDFMLAAAATILYWRYVRTCEQKLKSFLHRVMQEFEASKPKTLGE